MPNDSTPPADETPDEAPAAPAEPPAEAPAKNAKKAAATTPPVDETLFPTKVAFGLAVASGLLYWLGFPGVDIWPLAFVSQVPFLLALRGRTPKRAAQLGLVAGLTMNITGFAWLLDMLRVFSGFPTALCFLFMVILCAYQGGRIALAGFLYARAERRGWPPGIVFGLAFVASELLYPLLFPWYFGASVHNAPVFMQVGDLGGPYAIAAVLLGSNVAIAEIVEARMRSRAPSPRVLAIGFALPVLGLLYGLVRMSMVESAMAAAPVVKVGIAQGNQPLLGRTRALPVHLELTEQLRAQGAELVVWSEGAVPGLYPETAKLDLLRTRVTSKLHVPAIVGAALSRREEGRSKYFNTALLTDETGAVIGRYDKTYLLAFGEYLPLGERFPILYKWSPNSGKFVPGSKLDPVKLGDHVITTMICYEDILPEFVNSLVRAGDPELLVNLTNDAWFGDTSEPWEHLALAKLRAVEHRRYLVRATNSGVSAIVDAVGHVVKHGDTFREETIVGDARYMRSKTLFEITGDAPVWIATILVIAMGFRARKPA